MGWPVDIIFNSIKKYEENKKFFSDKEWNDSNVFFRSATCNINFPLYIDFSYLYPNASEVSQMIRNAGGKVFLAHLYIYPIDNHIAFLDMLREANIIDGIEVYYPIYTDKQIKTLEEYCRKYHLFMCGGTDFHGAKKLERSIGKGFGNMKISESIIKSWHK